MEADKDVVCNWICRKCEVVEGLKPQGQHKRVQWGGGSKVLLTWERCWLRGKADEIGGLEIRIREGAEQV